jgi:hypothetical protein
LSKYNNKKTIYNGVEYDSQLEASVAQDLTLKMMSITQHDKSIKLWEAHVPVVFWLVGKRHVYTFDFYVEYNDGTEEYWEVKGRWAPQDRWRLRACMEYKSRCFNPINVRVIYGGEKKDEVLFYDHLQA